jgi:type IV secretion system protein VirB10
MGMPEAPAEGRDATGRDFVQSGRAATATEVSQVIANPSNTVLQGTMIEATLENAVDSSLPGQITAIVTRPVWSFDQAQVLIPAGSRLFGDYSSNVAIGQGRILVSWTRLVTPDGQSVQMEAFGGDAQGRSGLTGKVNTRFGARFGSAALISLLGAAPAIAAAKYTDEISSDTAESMGEDLSGAMGSAVEAYTSLPPIITLAPGAAITVMVDRDLEIW